MLIPQYSLRWLLGATTVCAMACSVFAMAMRGSLLAAAVSMAIAALVAIELVHVLLFVMVWLFSLAFAPGRSAAAKDAEQAVLLVLALVVSWAAAGGGPAGAQTLSGNGLQMDVAFVALGARPGYRPVRISALPTAAVTADRTLSIEILLGRTTDGYDLRVVKELEIPAGSGLQTMTIPVSELAGGDLYRVNVSEDHIPLNALCVPWTTYSSYWSEALPAILFMGSSLPDTSGLAAALPPYAGGVYYGGVQPPVRTSPFASPQLATADNWAMRDFSEQWIDYSGFDIVCLSHEQLAALRQSRPAVLRALVAWTAAGGNLWVWGVGDQWQHVPELEKLLELPPGRGAAERGAPPGWTVPDKWSSAHFGQPDFVFHPLQAGLVVALHAAEPFPGGANWRGLLDSMGEGRWHWYQRHGLSLKRDNPDYWNFLIPGVGMAPVTQFCVLITLFVIGIGPVNYWLLRRRRQLHLLLLTIPGSAAAVTLLLLGYALVADGLDVRVRARSVTYLDQRSGRAVCWTRLSYFAGLAPRGGLRFPGDTVVLPLEHQPGRVGGEPPLYRELLWEDDQHLASGWLASRTPAQFVTIRSRKSAIALDLVEAPGKAPAVRNRLQTPIKRLLVQTRDGKYYRARAVPVGATAALEPISAPADAGVLELIGRDRLDVPPGASQISSGEVFNRRYYMYMYDRESVQPPAVATSRLEKMRSGPAAPGGYVAVVERSPEVVFGVSAPREEPSSHVIVGEF